MHKVNVWKTSDGHHFDTEPEAARHEAFEELGKMMAAHLNVEASEAIIEIMLARAEEVANIFAKYAKLHPQSRKTAESSEENDGPVYSTP